MGDNSSSKPNVAHNTGSVRNDTNSGSTLAKMPTPSTSYNTNSYSHNNSMLGQPIDQSNTHPIASLSPYHNKWVIKARVLSKSAIRTWSNAKGEGKLFSMDLMDESGEIRATAFKEQCDKFYDMIEVDKVYFISKCQLKPANKQFCTLKNDYEMTFTNDTVVQLCTDDEASIPQVQYDIVPISQIANIEPKAVVDIIGVCREIGELQVFTGKTNNREFKERDLTLVDSSNASIQLTLWEEGHKLRGWFDNGGGENISNNVSARTGGMGGSLNTEWLTFYEARKRNFGSGDKPDYFQTKACINIIKSTNVIYKGCPQLQCNKKVVEEGNGHYRCDKCNATFGEFKYKLLLNMSIADYTGNRWVTCFNDVADKLYGKSSQEIGEIMENDEEKGMKLLSSISFKSFVFKVRSKNEVYGDMSRNKLTIMSAAPVNYKDYNNYLIKNLQELTGFGKN